MNQPTPKTPFWQLPANFGFASLIAAALMFVGSWLIAAVGVFGGGLLILVLAFAGVVSGLWAVGAGFYRKDWVAIVTGSLGVALIGLMISWFVSALMHF